MKMNAENKSVPPSLALGFLSAPVGIRIVDLVRYSWWPAEDVASECNISDEQAFSLTAGPLGIFFENGEILGLASDPSMNSVMVWNEGGRYISSPGATLEQDGELFPISAQDQEYAAPFWKKVIGATVVQLEVLKPKVMSIKKRELPRFCLKTGVCDTCFQTEPREQSSSGKMPSTIGSENSKQEVHDGFQICSCFAGWICHTR